MKKNQSGFGVAGIIIIVLVIALVGAVGYMVMNKNKDKTDTTSVTSKDSASSADTSETSATSKDYLEIVELGVKIKLADGVRDMTYAKTAQGTYGLSTTALEVFADTCKASANKVAYIYSFTDQNAQSPVGSGTNKASFPDATMVGTTYYAVDYSSLAQSPCDSSVTSMKETDAQYMSYIEAVKAAKAGFAAVSFEKL